MSHKVSPWSLTLLFLLPSPAFISPFLRMNVRRVLRKVNCQRHWRTRVRIAEGVPKSSEPTWKRANAQVRVPRPSLAAVYPAFTRTPSCPDALWSGRACSDPRTVAPTSRPWICQNPCQRTKPKQQSSRLLMIKTLQLRLLSPVWSKLMMRC